MRNLSGITGGGGQLLKSTDTRRVVRSGRHLIKGFQSGFLRRLIRLDPARREWEVANALYLHGLAPRPERLFYENGWGYFVSAFLENAESAEKLLTGGDVRWQDPEGRAALVSAFVRFLGDLFETRVFQPDFHLGNILYDSSSGRFLMVDLHRAHLLKGGYTRREQLALLSYLLPCVQDDVPFPLRASVYRRLSTRYPALRERPAETLFSLGEKAFTRRRRQWIKKTRRRLLARGTIQELTADGGTGFVSQEAADRGLLEDLAANPEKIFASPLRTIKDKEAGRIAVVRIGNLQCFAQSRRVSGWKRLKESISARLERAWWMGWALVARGIATPRPLLFLKQGTQTYLLTEALPDEALSLKAMIKIRDRRLHTLVRKLAFEIWNLHARGIHHRDLKASNVFCLPEASSFLFIDLDGARELSCLSRRQRLDDLSEIMSSFADLWPDSSLDKVLFAAYTRYQRPFKRDKSAFHEVMTLVEKRVRHRRKRRGYDSSSGTL